MCLVYSQQNGVCTCSAPHYMKSAVCPSAPPLPPAPAGPTPASAQQVTCVTVQAASWLSWEHAVGSSRTSSLQLWSGSQWQQSDFPSPDKLRRSLLLATTPTPPTQDAAAPATPHKQATGSASPSNGAGARKGSSAEDAAQPASLSAFTAQAMLECHYSQNGAFLQEPLLQVLTMMSPALHTQPPHAAIFVNVSFLRSDGSSYGKTSSPSQYKHCHLLCRA